MKTMLLSVCLAGWQAVPSLAQTIPAAKVPAAARRAFKASFPAVLANTWEREGANLEAGFRLNGRAMSAVITPSGKLVETETTVPVAALPAAVRASLAREFKTYQITEAATIVRATGSPLYEAEVSKAGKHRDVLFHADGTHAGR